MPSRQVQDQQPCTASQYTKRQYSSITDLAAEGRGSLLAATLPGAVGAVDVVEAGNATLDAEVLVVVLAQLLSGELLQAIGIL